MNRFRVVLVLFLFFIGTGVVLAENGQDAKKDNALKISGVFFGEYAQALNGDKDGSFALQRMYLTMKKNLPGVFSFRVTLDCLGLEDSNKEGYEALVKFAYLQAAPKLGPVDLTIRGGMINTPATSIVNGLTGLRWVGNTYIGAAKEILHDASGAILGIDTAADLGLSVQAKFLEMVTLTGAFTNGEGYKNVDVDNFHDGFSYYTTLSVNPVKNIFINGYFRFFEKAVNNDIIYYGGGAAWKSKMLRAGANFIGVTNDTGSSDNGYFVEGWLNANFDSVIGMPVLLICRVGYAHGLDGADNGKYGFGAGYKFNKNVQLALYYEISDFEAADTDHMMYCKAEVKI